MNGRIVSFFGIVTILVFTFSMLLRFQVVKAEPGTIYIRANGSVDPPTAPIQRVGDVYTLIGNIISDADGIVIERNNMTVDGAGYTVQGAGVYPSTGISLYERTNVTVRNAQIKNFYLGISLSSSSNSSISGNNITNNQDGIYHDWSYNNTIIGNNITANNDIGFYLHSSSDNSIIGNNITDNFSGIYLDHCSNNSISGNNITDNTCGVSIESSSSNNIISGNNIANNSVGVSLSDSSNNNFYHNNFDNAEQVHVYPYGQANFWDDGYPSGGNYWSDYDGSDANHDGIGDTEYMIDENNTDHYPLMNPYVIPEFPSLLILPLFMTATLLAVILCKRKRISIG